MQSASLGLGWVRLSNPLAAGVCGPQSDLHSGSCHARAAGFSPARTTWPPKAEPTPNPTLHPTPTPKVLTHIPYSCSPPRMGAAAMLLADRPRHAARHVTKLVLPIYTVKPMLIAKKNVPRRMGAAAMLLTDRPRHGAKYVLTNRVRVHMGGTGDAAYGCIRYGPDERGLNGTYLGLDVVKEASKGLTIAMTKVRRRTVRQQHAAQHAAGA